MSGFTSAPLRPLKSPKSTRNNLKVAARKCSGVIVPVYPEAGQICKGRLRFEVRVAKHGGCTDPEFIAGILSGDSVEIQLAKAPSFDTVVVRARFASLGFQLDEVDLRQLTGYVGPIYWRVRLIPAAARPALSKASAVSDGDWSLARPVVFDPVSVPVRPRSGRTESAPQLRRTENGLVSQGSREPQVFDLAGGRLETRFRRIPGEPGAQAYWVLESFPSGSGLLWVR